MPPHIERMVKMVAVYVLLYLITMIIGMGLMVTTPFNSWLDSGRAVFLPLEFFPGLILLLISFFFLNLTVKEMDRQMEKAKQKYLKLNGLSPDSSITLRHEKHYVDFPVRLISIKLANGQEYLTDICQVDSIEETWDVFFFELPETSVAVLRHKRSKKWEVYSKQSALN